MKILTFAGLFIITLGFLATSFRLASSPYQNGAWGWFLFVATISLAFTYAVGADAMKTDDKPKGNGMGD